MYVFAHLNYAIIKDKLVMDINVFPDSVTAEYMAKAAYGNEACAVDVTQVPCQPGDEYIDGEFYRKEKDKKILISKLPDPEIQILSANSSIRYNEDYILDLENRVSILELGI